MPNVRDLQTDAILTAFSLEYKPEDMIGDMVLPRVRTDTKAGRYFSFAAGDSLRARDTRKRGNGDFHENEHSADDSAQFQQDEQGLEEFVPDIDREDFSARSRGVVDLRTSTTDILTWQVMNSREKRVANLVQDLTEYPAANKTTLAGADQWSDNSSDPQQDIEAAKEVTLFVPNTLILSFAVFQVLKRHPQIRDNFKYTTAKSITADMLAGLFDLDKVLVGKAREATNNPGQPETFARIWSKNTVLAQIDQNPGLKARTFGFSPEMKPRRVLSVRSSRGSGGEIIKVVEVVGEKISDARMGFIWENSIA